MKAEEERKLKEKEEREERERATQTQREAMRMTDADLLGTRVMEKVWLVGFVCVCVYIYI